MRVLVVGGGIGGLSITIALRQRGVAVDVVEINPRWDVYGVGSSSPPTRSVHSTRSASRRRPSIRASR